MAFVQPEEGVPIAIDTNTGSRVVIKSTPQIEWMMVEFTSPEASLETAIEIRRKFPDRPVISNDPQNPCVKVSAAYLNRAFAAKEMLDTSVNTALTKRLVRMIAFLSPRSSICNAPFLWSDYHKLPPDKRLYLMPSDEELLKLSFDPEPTPPASARP